MHQKQLPPDWVERLFQKLALTYGRDFLSRWEGQDLAAVKADWALELGGFLEAPESIKYALENLPASKPPTVLEFRSLCRNAPQAKQLALPAPEADPAIARAIRDALKPANGQTGNKDWARALRKREAGQTEQTPGSVRLTSFQRHAWRYALNMKPDAKAAVNSEVSE